MADRFMHCDKCQTVTIQTVSGSGKKKICVECEDKRIRKEKGES